MRSSHTKDKVQSELVPPVISECALGISSPCTSHNTIQQIGSSLGVGGSDTDIMNIAKTQLGCDTEKCVLSKSHLDERVVRTEIAERLKIAGPTDSRLLSNVNIDKILAQWKPRFQGFFPYNFNMLNYASYSYSNGYILDKPEDRKSTRLNSSH